jgi:hypothetical protein
MKSHAEAGLPCIHQKRKCASAGVSRIRFIPGLFAAEQARGHGESAPVGEKLDSGAVICQAVPGMREEIILGAVIELIPRS